MQTLGCIGCGNMGSALLRGFASALDKSAWQIICNDLSDTKMHALEDLGISALNDPKDVCAKSDILILAVKPAQMPSLLDSLRTSLKKNTIVVSIAAGYSLQYLRLLLGIDNVLVRCMPTITAAVDRGIFALTFDPLNLDQQTQNEVTTLFESLGMCVTLTEPALNDFAAFVGAGPAYVFACMQGLAQAGLTLGFTHEQNRKMMIELFAGCAELAKRNDKSFNDLKDSVCSPGGLTIAGINVLDGHGLNNIMVDAVKAAKYRGNEMEKDNSK